MSPPWCTRRARRWTRVKYAIRLGDGLDFTDCLFEPLSGQGGERFGVGGAQDEDAAVGGGRDPVPLVLGGPETLPRLGAVLFLARLAQGSSQRATCCRVPAS